MLQNVVVLYRRTITFFYIVSTDHKSRVRIPTLRLDRADHALAAALLPSNETLPKDIRGWYKEAMARLVGDWDNHGLPMGLKDHPLPMLTVRRRRLNTSG